MSFIFILGRFDFRTEEYHGYRYLIMQKLDGKIKDIYSFLIFGNCKQALKNIKAD